MFEILVGQSLDLVLLLLVGSFSSKTRASTLMFIGSAESQPPTVQTVIVTFLILPVLVHFLISRQA
jgi:hypothetical protein